MEKPVFETTLWKAIVYELLHIIKVTRSY